MVDTGGKVCGNHYTKADLTFGAENGGGDQWLLFNQLNN